MITQEVDYGSECFPARLVPVAAEDGEGLNCWQRPDCTYKCNHACFFCPSSGDEWRLMITADRRWINRMVCTRCRFLVADREREAAGETLRGPALQSRKGVAPGDEERIATIKAYAARTEWLKDGTMTFPAESFEGDALAARCSCPCHTTCEACGNSSTTPLLRCHINANYSLRLMRCCPSHLFSGYILSEQQQRIRTLFGDSRAKQGVKT